MLKCQKNKLWLENITNLFCNFSLVPLDGMSLAEQMNALSRLVIMVFLVLLLLGFRHSLLFLLLSLLFIIILYYIQKKNMETFKAEYYKCPSNFSRFCNDETLLDGPCGVFNNPDWMSKNQKLVGAANPKTLIPPVVAAPSHDLSYWKANNLVTHSAINEETQIDVYQSGYYSEVVPLQEGYCGDCFNDRRPRDKPKPTLPPVPPVPPGSGGGTFDYTTQQKVGYPYNQLQVQENFQIPYLKTGQVSIAHSAGICAQDPAMKQYNENLYTQTIQPGVYTRNEINEPINSNIGISFTQQFPPTTCKTNMWSDPRIIEPPVTEANIYDPRFSGYGTSYRSYTDDNIGQTRFYYDDVNAIRMPNYITRSNIDFAPFADHYGPLPPGDACGNKNHADIRALANDAFLQASLQQRNDLTERLLRKRNSEMWQLRHAPVRTSNQRMLGGMASCK